MVELKRKTDRDNLLVNQIKKLEKITLDELKEKFGEEIIIKNSYESIPELVGWHVPKYEFEFYNSKDIMRGTIGEVNLEKKTLSVKYPQNYSRAFQLAERFEKESSENWTLVLDYE